MTTQHTPGPIVNALVNAYTRNVVSEPKASMFDNMQRAIDSVPMIAAATEMLGALKALNSALAQADINWENNRELAVLRRDAFNVTAKAEGRG